ncbi:toll/interleukin-1 receptor domain-containing protein [Polyangium mundeleinium]|uniref:Toll/interleukin-1 receptor domain-containing protein n=1 Tax=Polyangium mundeleinium TaxID=2995306 RepID=A0ABT5EIB6_9BACT|nr:toll/interleukin-1 receptor domain-containing protein [Polyangium mundeleinium]MDC0740928.1 toll/interleukin-1 receptor domain-containing protein [Polyangium mundeleinium]
MKPIDVFFSYSHRDEAMRDELAAHLSSLRRSGLIHEWHDRLIPAGESWKHAIDVHLEKAHLVLVLVSADFIASNYCYEIEMKRALERREAGQARVVPIIVRACDWHQTPLGALQALPRDAKPVAEWQSRDAAWTDVARGIRAVVEGLARP